MTFIRYLESLWLELHSMINIIVVYGLPNVIFHVSWNIRQNLKTLNVLAVTALLTHRGAVFFFYVCLHSFFWSVFVVYKSRFIKLSALYIFIFFIMPMKYIYILEESVDTHAQQVPRAWKERFSIIAYWVSIHFIPLSCGFSMKQYCSEWCVSCFLGSGILNISIVGCCSNIHVYEQI